MFNNSIVIALVVAVFSILYSLVLYRVVIRNPEGNKKTIDNSKELQISAKKFLSRKYSIVSMVATIVFVSLLYGLGWQIAIGFLVGIISSVLVGIFGMNIAVRTNPRMVDALKKDLHSVFNISFKSGSATGLFVYGIGLLVVVGLYAIYRDVTVLVGLVLGSSVISIFSRVSNLFLKEETRAENISKSVNTISDLFETFLLVLVAAIVSANLFLNDVSNAVIFPIVLVAAFIITNIISTWFIRFSGNSKKITVVLYRGLIISVVLSAIASYFITRWMFKANIIQNLSGYYGFSILIVFVLTTLGTIISLLVFGQTTKDAANISKAVELPNDLIVQIDEFESAGESTEKTTKYFSVISAFLVAVVVFAGFGEKISKAREALSFDLRDYHIIIGLLVGGIFSYYFFRTFKKVSDKTISINGSIIESFIAILLPVFVGFVLGPVTLGGFLIGAILTGLFLAISASTTIMNSIIKIISVNALLIAPAIVTVNLGIKLRLIISAILIVLLIISTLIFSSKNKAGFLKWLRR